MVASLLSYSESIDLAAAEDIAQESFSVALVDWRKKGIPSNTAGWIYTVCRNRAINYLKKSAHVILPDIDFTQEDFFAESPVEDPQLRLLFSCANPDLPPKSQVVVTLKYVAGLKVEAIARLFAMTLDGVDKILVRARQKLKADNLFREMDATALQSRLPIVTKIIYLIFNEGYRSSWGKELTREELCEEALTLNNALLKGALADEKTYALQALMMFNNARMKSRFDVQGEIVELEKQDRTLWNADLIAMATEFLDRSRGGAISTYHTEASIAYLHCTAISFEATPWPLIAKLYAQLLREHPNPFIEINYAIALFYAGETARAFALLDNLQRHPFFHQYFLLTAAIGKLCLLAGDDGKARQ